MSGRPNRQAAATAAGVALVVAVALLDALLADTAVLRPLLVVGPLVAALGATPRATGLVGALAVAACVLLGLSDDDLGAWVTIRSEGRFGRFRETKTQAAVARRAAERICGPRC